MRTETLGVQNDLGLDLHSQEEPFDSGVRSLESQICRQPMIRSTISELGCSA